MATVWKTGMKMTPARLNDGSSIVWTSKMIVTAGRWVSAFGIAVTAGDPATPQRLNGG